jgi:hypothetical protein
VADQDRAIRIADNPFGDAAHEQAGQPFAAMGTHDDEAGGDFRRQGGNGLVGLAIPHEKLRPHAEISTPFFDLVQNLVRFLVEFLHDFLAKGVKLVIGINHGNGGEFYLPFLGYFQGPGQGVVTASGAVRGQQDVLPGERAVFRNNQDILAGMSDDPGGDAAHEFPLHLGLAPAAHDDQIAVLFFRNMDDLLVGLALFQIGQDVDPFAVRQLPGLGQHFLAGSGDGFLDIRNTDKFQVPLIGGDNGQHLDPALVLPGKPACQGERVLGRGRTVVGNEDLPVLSHCLLPGQLFCFCCRRSCP